MSVRERAVRMRAVLPLCTYVLGYCFGSLLLCRARSCCMEQHAAANGLTEMPRSALPCPGNNSPCPRSTLPHPRNALPCPGSACLRQFRRVSVFPGHGHPFRGRCKPLRGRCGPFPGHGRSFRGCCKPRRDGAGRSGPRRPVPGAWLRAAAPRTWAVCPALRGRARPIAGGCTAPCRSPGRL